jgi:hypothetical protein
MIDKTSLPGSNHNSPHNSQHNSPQPNLLPRNNKILPIQSKEELEIIRVLHLAIWMLIKVWIINNLKIKESYKIEQIISRYFNRLEILRQMLH